MSKKSNLTNTAVLLMANNLGWHYDIVQEYCAKHAEEFEKFRKEYESGHAKRAIANRLAGK